MKIRNSIRIKKETIGEIRSLEAVKSVEQTPNGNIVVRIRPDCTDGREEAVLGEYLVQWENGKWQRFGSEAYHQVIKNSKNYTKW